MLGFYTTQRFAVKFGHRFCPFAGNLDTLLVRFQDGLGFGVSLYSSIAGSMSLLDCQGFFQVTFLAVALI